MGGQQMSTRKNSVLVGIILKKTAMPSTGHSERIFALKKNFCVPFTQKKEPLRILFDYEDGGI